MNEVRSTGAPVRYARFAGVIAGLATVVIGAINGISLLAGRPSPVSVWLFAISVGLLLCAATFFGRSIASDAPAFALIGPASCLSALLCLISGYALYLAVNHANPTAVWSFDVVFAAVFFIGLGILKAAQSIVGNASLSDRFASPAAQAKSDEW
jgi:hypothetical protein